MTLQALIFDVDGTLADTERYGHRVAFNRAFAEAGLDWHWSADFYRELLTIAGGKERIRFFIDQYLRDFQPPRDLNEFITQLHLSKTSHYGHLLAQEPIPLRPGVKRLLIEAKLQGVRLAIATTTALPNVTALLEHSLAPDAPSWFEVIAAGDIVPAKKPAPHIYNYVLDFMGLPATNCLVFEDSIHGLQAASGAGLKTVITVNDYTKDQDFAHAVLVLDHLGEPEQPFTVLAGDLGEVNYLDLALAESVIAGGRRQEAGGRRQKAEGRRQEAEGRRQEAEGRRQEAGGRRQEAEGRRQKE